MVAFAPSEYIELGTILTADTTSGRWRLGSAKKPNFVGR
jgi:hypothetical protein